MKKGLIALIGIILLTGCYQRYEVKCPNGKTILLEGRAGISPEAEHRLTEMDCNK